jgi:serine/threonine protein kinase
LANEIRLLKEVRGNSRLVQLNEIYESEDLLQLVSNFCVGGELYEVIVQEGRLSEKQSLRHLMSLLEVSPAHPDPQISGREKDHTPRHQA